MALLFYLSSLPTRPPTPGMEGFRWDDKLQHAGAYAVLAALIWRALGREVDLARRAWLTVAVASGYGFLDEVHQYLVPTREFSMADWAMDTLGPVLLVLILILREGGDIFGRRTGT